MTDAIEYCRTELAEANTVEIKRVVDRDSVLPNSLNIVFKDLIDDYLLSSDDTIIPWYTKIIVDEILKRIDEKDIPNVIQVTFFKGNAIFYSYKSSLLYKDYMKYRYDVLHSLLYVVSTRVNELVEANQKEKALTVCDSAIIQEPDNEVGYLYKGVVSCLLYDTITAIENFKKTALINNKNYNTYINLGICYINRNPRLALKYIDTSLTISPNSPKSIYYRGEARIKMHDWENGCKDLEKAKELGIKEAVNALIIYCGYQYSLPPPTQNTDSLFIDSFFNPKKKE